MIITTRIELCTLCVWLFLFSTVRLGRLRRQSPALTQLSIRSRPTSAVCRLQGK
nr:MAG TPA: hypothetical protein [Bacteriophage sp.]